MQPYDAMLLTLGGAVGMIAVFSFLVWLNDRKEQRRHRSRAAHGSHRSE